MPGGAGGMATEAQDAAIKATMKNTASPINRYLLVGDYGLRNLGTGNALSHGQELRGAQTARRIEPRPRRRVVFAHVAPARDFGRLPSSPAERSGTLARLVARPSTALQRRLFTRIQAAPTSPRCKLRGEEHQLAPRRSTSRAPFHRCLAVLRAAASSFAFQTGRSCPDSGVRPFYAFTD